MPTTVALRGLRLRGGGSITKTDRDTGRVQRALLIEATVCNVADAAVIAPLRRAPPWPEVARWPNEARESTAEPDVLTEAQPTVTPAVVWLTVRFRVSTS